jgi:pimeloyl-ACP methyl ester carboxylesterase
MPVVTANGIRIAYEEKGNGPPLLLIMGLGAPGALWEKHVAAYARHFRCILMDNRGAGMSEQPMGPYTTRMMAEDAAGLLDALQIPRARVAGISMGSAIAQHLALAHPAKVDRLILISSWARCDAYTADVFRSLGQIRMQAIPADFTQLLQLWIYSPEYYAAHGEELTEGRNAAMFGSMPQHAFASQCEACITHDALEELRRIQQPALLTVGSADIFTPLRLSEAIRERMPRAEQLIFPGLGHAHHWEALAEFNQKTLEFLSQP